MVSVLNSRVVRADFDVRSLARALPLALPALLFRGGCCPSDSGGSFQSIPVEVLVRQTDGAVVIPMGDAALTPEQCAELCASLSLAVRSGCRLLRDVDGGVSEVQCQVPVACYAGRAPSGLAPVTSASGDALARYFADTQRMEAAAVQAFEILAGELTAHGAPRSLVARSLRAADDERRHAALTAAIALAQGAALLPLALAPVTPRGFAPMVVENAVEGCARETVAAMVALHQARHAADPTARAAFALIADDELSHAALSWDLARWTARHSAPTTRREAREGWRDAVESLRPTRDVDDGFARALGLPDGRTQHALLDALGRFDPARVS